jgi:hypothetical protein
MKNSRNGNTNRISPLQREAEEVEAAVRRAVRKSLRDHKRTGDPIVVFRDGEVRWIPANEIQIPSSQT